MLCIYSPETNPAFNIASEEYLMKNIDQDVFLLYINGPSIIVGKHQNTLSEINVDYVKENNIEIVRRLSGGGAVFHDQGNLNFAFIKKGEDTNLVDFQKFTIPILDVLRKLDINAKFEGRNDLTIEGKKFSGNAEHVYKNKVLHHGTLLFSSKMEDLGKALNVNPRKFKDKAVKSVKSRVTNIKEHLQKDMSVDEFAEMLMQDIMQTEPESKRYEYTEADQEAIQSLVEQKYGTWEWNFGYSPKYNFSRYTTTQGGHIEVNLDVIDGVINNVKFFGDFFSSKDIGEIEDALKGIQHNEVKIRKQLEDFNISQYFNKVTLDELVGCLF
ncbi:MAG: lipoate--protein ligase [Bacteroidales bacterium]|nr:lipoate--protein ligase [Bacteroidales bacterium]MCF8327796.1 lipoate--protein ligase [Bacteroidales bacterium]